MREVFNISLGAFDWRLDRSFQVESETGGKSVYLIHGFYPLQPVSHDTATPDFTTTNFELRFDEDY
jgi:hypothetical protein